MFSTQEKKSGDGDDQSNCHVRNYKDNIRRLGACRVLMAILILLSIGYLPALLANPQAVNGLGSVTIPKLAQNEPIQTTFIQNMGKTDRALCSYNPLPVSLDNNISYPKSKHL
jgi:hypothetical protein